MPSKKRSVKNNEMKSEKEAEKGKQKNSKFYNQIWFLEKSFANFAKKQITLAKKEHEENITEEKESVGYSGLYMDAICSKLWTF